ncbi:MAG: Uma2 family endonuclease [Saprospiraceae bacterium]|nr:Uma2 family endonuclease [Saprospiraceae bacterium]MCF8249167.1 Uma2 family endonuclease [Saprospiraceae bacterium]MCF8278891.1 Uma2 family endonuclease [Bacteroidales bacterium]MCF8311296.1 Uma2 family endonuclease [Saprospiraceae bacterium]MCF8440140.1 Uma2 family endonuclease [Saprospiraceae bacterium]
MVAETTGTYTVQEYLKLERRTGRKYAFYDGKLEQMAGGTLPHNTVSANVFGLLYPHIISHPEMQIFSSDQKIYLPKFNFYLYPDVVVITGEPIVTDNEADAIINPLLIIETLSKNTERYDRGQKFVEYQSLPSFKEYVLLRQDAPEAYCYFREEPDVWRSKEVAGLENEVHFQSIDFRLELTKIYYKVKFGDK